MDMVVDVILAVAVIAVAPGTVPELQLRVGDIGSAADPAAVGEIPGLGIGFGNKGDRAGGFGCFHFSGSVQEGEYITDASSHKQQVVGNRHQREQVVGKIEYGDGQVEDLRCYHYKVDKGNDPALNGNYEEDQESGIGIQGGKGEQKAQMEVVCHVVVNRQGSDEHSVLCVRYSAIRDHRAEDHGKYIHEQDTGQVKEIKPEGSHALLHMPAQHIEEIQENKTEEGIG